MNAIQQHIFDVYRSARLGAPVPPAPGLNDWQVVREVRDHQRFRAVAEDRSARSRRLRTAVANLLSRRAADASGTRSRTCTSRPRSVCSGSPRTCS